jgi:hypothetical protein
VRVKIQSLRAGSIISAFQCRLTLPVELISALGLKSRLMCKGHLFRSAVVLLFEGAVSFCAKPGDSSNVKVARRAKVGKRKVSMIAMQRMDRQLNSQKQG